jgi:SAM-dependent methyltransferase
MALVRYAQPPAEPPALSDCRFYHSIELPGIGLQQGHWDLRGGYDDYFGGHDFSGERVLDIGTSSGALAFEIERRGASEVVAFDLDEGLTYDCRLPTTETALAEFRAQVAQTKNAFWLGHHLLASSVKVAYGHAGALPAELGRFDAIVMGNILQHLQDPVGAVLQAARHSDHLIITEADWMRGVVADDFIGMLMFDLPTPYSWYQVKPGLLRNLLGRWGFVDQELTWHDQSQLVDAQFAEDGTVTREPAHVPVPHYTLSLKRPG